VAIALNHTIVHAHDARASARFLTELFGLPDPVALFGHFQAVELQHGLSLDYADVAPGEEVVPQHYAFLVSEADFDEIFGRIQARGMEFWADPGRTQPGEIATWKGRGVYFLDPSGHFLEIITEPYID